MAGTRSFTIPASVTAIDQNAFKNCDNLSTVTFLGSNINSIGTDAFAGCPVLTKVDYPDAARWAQINFANKEASPLNQNGKLYINNTLLQSANLTGITSIKQYAFYNQNNLTSITLPSTVSSIGQYAFANSGITSIDIPDAVSRINEGTFEGCSNLTNVTLGSGIQVIGKNAFHLCYKMASLVIESVNISNVNDGGFFFWDANGAANTLVVTVPNIDSWARINFETETSTPFTSGTNIHYIKINGGSKVTSATINVNVGAYAFCSYKHLATVNFGSSVYSIGKYAFKDAGINMELNLYSTNIDTIN